MTREQTARKVFDEQFKKSYAPAYQLGTDKWLLISKRREIIDNDFTSLYIRQFLVPSPLMAIKTHILTSI